MFGCLNYHTVLLQLLVQCMYFISVLFQYCKDKVGTKHDPSQVPNEKFKTKKLAQIPQEFFFQISSCSNSDEP